jgi:hypothetical protein
MVFYPFLYIIYNIMPPIKLLVGDDKFYGKIKPTGEPVLPENYAKKNTPPNPVTPHVRFTTKDSQEISKRELNRAIANPEPVKSETFDPVKDQRQEKIDGTEQVKEYVNEEKSIGKRFTDFLQGEIVETTKEAKEQQKKRELGRIGVAEDPIDNTIRPVGEVPYEPAKRAGEFIMNNIQQLFILGVGIYLVGQFLQNPALVNRGGARRNTAKKNAIVEE